MSLAFLFGNLELKRFGFGVVCLHEWLSLCGLHNIRCTTL
jgi:hypothetical protein